MSREVSVKEFRDMLKANGFTYARKAKGSHEVWQNKDGVSFVIPVTRKNVHLGLVWQFKRFLKTSQLSYR